TITDLALPGDYTLQVWDGSLVGPTQTAYHDLQHQGRYNVTFLAATLPRADAWVAQRVEGDRVSFRVSFPLRATPSTLTLAPGENATVEVAMDVDNGQLADGWKE